MQETKPGVWQFPPQQMVSLYVALLALGATYSRRFGVFARYDNRRKNAKAINALIDRFNKGDEWCSAEMIKEIA